MKQVLGCAAAVIFGVFLAGCSSWNEKKCEQTNWYAMGQKYGSEGAYYDIDAAARQCQRHHVTINMHNYHVGYLAGLRRFCTPAAALRYGQSGHHYLGQCQQLSMAQDKAFRSQWQAGLKHYCQPSVVRQRGINGKAFPNWCPDSRLAKLSVAYQQGVDLREKRRNMQDHINFLRNRIRQINGELDKLYAQGASSTNHTVLQLQKERTHLQNELFTVRQGQYNN